MSGNRFEVKGDDERTPKGGKYHRGHYDVVILNPDFISQHSYEAIKAQNYKLYRSEVLSRSEGYGQVILYGLEFAYSRDPLKYSRGKDRENQISSFTGKVVQDADKLLASTHMMGFIDRAKMLTFLKGSPEDICSLIAERLSWRDEIVVCCSD